MNKKLNSINNGDLSCIVFWFGISYLDYLNKAIEFVVLIWHKCLRNLIMSLDNTNGYI